MAVQDLAPGARVTRLPITMAAVLSSTAGLAAGGGTVGTYAENWGVLADVLAFRGACSWRVVTTGQIGEQKSST